MSGESLRRMAASIWEVVEVILIAFITVYVIRSFVAQPFLVSGASMEPNYKNNEYLLIDELTYRFRTPERGEVIVFLYPGDEKSYFIKRIIGLPGEHVTISDNHVSIEPVGSNTPMTITESYLPGSTTTFGQKTVVLGSDEYFVMGDNRGNSFDSRNWGPLKKDHIKGLVRLRLFPFSRFGTMSAPSYSIVNPSYAQ